MRRLTEVTRSYIRSLRASVRRAIASPDFTFATTDWVMPERTRLFWFIQTHHDVSRLDRTLSELRTLYPESDVLVVSDGDTDQNIPTVCQAHKVRFQLQYHLMSVARGGEPVQQMLEAFLLTTADVLIKIDPDTHLRRRFSLLPSRADKAIYGTVQAVQYGDKSLTSIQGGCIIVPRAAAQIIADSSVLLSDRLKPPAIEWAVNEESRARAHSGLTSHDWTIGWSCRLLALDIKNHPEVFSRHRPSLADTMVDRRSAVSHPRFEVRQLFKSQFYFRGLRIAIREALDWPRSHA